MGGGGWNHQRQWRRPRELKGEALTNTHAECFSCAGTEKTRPTAPIICSIPMQPMDRATHLPLAPCEPWSWCFRLCTFNFSGLSLTCSSLHSEQKRKKTGLLSKNSAAVLNLVTQWLCNYMYFFAATQLLCISLLRASIISSQTQMDC